MLFKVALNVVALGACACTLLAMRQSRLQVASELTQTQLRINAADERLWGLRVRIGNEVSVERVQIMASEMGMLRPLAQAPLPEPPPEGAVESASTDGRKVSSAADIPAQR